MGIHQVIKFLQNFHPTMVSKPTMEFRNALNELGVPFGLNLPFTQATGFDFKDPLNINKWIGNRSSKQQPLLADKHTNILNQTVKKQLMKTDLPSEQLFPYIVASDKWLSQLEKYNHEDETKPTDLNELEILDEEDNPELVTLLDEIYVEGTYHLEIDGTQTMGWDLSWQRKLFYLPYTYEKLQKAYKLVPMWQYTHQCQETDIMDQATLSMYKHQTGSR